MGEEIEMSSASVTSLLATAMHSPPAVMGGDDNSGRPVASVGREAANDLRAFPSGWYVWRKLSHRNNAASRTTTPVGNVICKPPQR